MQLSEIQKWTTSALKAIPNSYERATMSATAALWEIAYQLAVANEREGKLSGGMAFRFRELRALVAANQRMAAALEHGNKKTAKSARTGKDARESSAM